MAISDSMIITGYATTTSTASLVSSSCSPDFYKYDSNLDLYLSSIGIGTYRGGISSAQQHEWINSIVLGFKVALMF